MVVAKDCVPRLINISFQANGPIMKRLENSCFDLDEEQQRQFWEVVGVFSRALQLKNEQDTAAYQVAALIDSLQLREWKYLTDGDCIDGSFTSVRFRNDDGSYETASTDNMPAGGEAMLHQVGSLLQQYATEENRLQ